MTTPNLDSIVTPPPARLVPDHLIKAARTVYRLNPYGGEPTFTQGRGPLCYGNAQAQSDELDAIARNARRLADAAEELSLWLTEASDE